MPTRAVAALLICGLLCNWELRAQAPPDLNATLKQADQLEEKNRLEEALGVLTEADRANPGRPEILWRLSNVYSQLVETPGGGTNKQYAQLCLDTAHQAVEKAPNEGEAHLALAIAYGKMTDFVDNKTKIQYSKYVKAEAEKAISLNPRLDDAYEILARWNLEMASLNVVERGFAQLFYGQLPPASKEKALEYFRKAIAIAPDRIIHHAEYAKALDQTGRQNEAKVQWRKVLQLRADDEGDRAYQREAAKRLPS
jgi:tetratricopeptide (TPR) repeat protein